MHRRVPSVRTHVRFWAFPAIVLLVGATVTSVATWQTERSLHAQNAERFRAVVDRLLDSVQARVDAYIDMLNAAAGLFAATPVDDP
ncbi:MAG: hypothetical protein AB7N65_19340, partial [Vicinamibacterales bacterium]